MWLTETLTVFLFPLSIAYKSEHMKLPFIDHKANKKDFKKTILRCVFIVDRILCKCGHDTLSPIENAYFIISNFSV